MALALDLDQFELHAQGPFSLVASARFLEGFSPAAYQGDDSGVLRLAFVSDAAFKPDGDQRAVAVSVRELGEQLVCIVAGLDGAIDPQIVQTQVERILSLNIDGSGFGAIGARDPVIGRLQERYPGLRPVLFFSPYEAAAWTLLVRRVRISQAAELKARLTQELGEAVEIDGEVVHAFPGPHRLVGLDVFPGLPEPKVRNLRALGEAASSGLLDADYLRSLPYEEATTLLRERLPGIGPFSAELILLRGAGLSDQLPIHEPRFGKALALAYGLAHPPAAKKIETMGKVWRPYRTWVAVLLRRSLEDETHEGQDQTDSTDD